MMRSSSRDTCSSLHCGCRLRIPARAKLRIESLISDAILSRCTGVICAKMRSCTAAASGLVSRGVFTVPLCLLPPYLKESYNARNISKRLREVGMRMLRLFLWFIGALLLIIDIRVADLLLNGFDVLYVGAEGRGWELYHWRITWADCIFFAALVAIHALVAFSLIRSRPRIAPPSLKTS